MGHQAAPIVAIKPHYCSPKRHALAQRYRLVCGLKGWLPCSSLPHCGEECRSEWQLIGFWAFSASTRGCGRCQKRRVSTVPALCRPLRARHEARRSLLLIIIAVIQVKITNYDGGTVPSEALAFHAHHLATGRPGELIRFKLVECTLFCVPCSWPAVLLGPPVLLSQLRPRCMQITLKSSLIPSSGAIFNAYVSSFTGRSQFAWRHGRSCAYSIQHHDWTRFLTISIVC